MLDQLNINSLTNTAKIALALVAAERAIESLKEVEQMYSLARQIIEAGWSWMSSRKPDPEAMYWEFNPILMEMDSNPEYINLYNQKPYIQYAFHCLIYAHYITIRFSETIEKRENPAKEYSTGSDITEVSNEFVIMCLDNCIKAAQSSIDTEVWVKAIVNKTLIQHNRASKGYIGEPINKDFFKDVHY